MVVEVCGANANLLPIKPPWGKEPSNFNSWRVSDLELHKCISLRKGEGEKEQDRMCVMKDGLLGLV
jgi:hypothetical protein